MSLSPSLLPLKKRALNDGSGGDGGSRDDGTSCSPSPNKKRRADEGSAAVVAAESEDAGGREAPAVPRSRRRCPAPKAEPLSAAEKYLQKGKWIATAQEAAAPPEPPVKKNSKKKKFMQDGIRSSFAETPARIERNQQAVVGDGDAPARVYADGNLLGAALERRLAELGATRPWFVYRKSLVMSDVHSNQNRLLVSCKRGTGPEGCPITACFSAAELRRVRDKEVGLLVTALDRDAAPVTLVCKFLESNGGYRFISEWKDFLERNGVTLNSEGEWERKVDVELWAFRSRALQRQPPLVNGRLLKGKDGKVDRTREVDDHFHKDGSLGLLLLHHESTTTTRAEPDDYDYDEAVGSPVVARHKAKRKTRGKRVVATAPASPAVARAGPGAEQYMSKAEMVDKFGEHWSNMVVGMIEYQKSLDDRVEGDGGAISKEEGRDSASREAPSRRRAGTSSMQRADMALD